MSESRDAQRRRILAALHALSESDDESALGISDALRRDLARLDGPREEGGVSDLVEFLLERIAEDEEVVQVESLPPGSHSSHGSDEWGTVNLSCPACRVLALAWSRPRVLAECEAKRAIVALRVWLNETARTSGPEEARSARDSRAAVDAVLRLLALPYADHPDYRDAWRP